MLLFEKIKQMNFSHTEQIILDYLLDNQAQLQKLTTTSIAKETFTSKALVVKIAKKLGYRGWIDFKEDLLVEFEYYSKIKKDLDANYPFKENDNIATIANNIAILKKQAIEDTLSLNSYASLKEAIQILHQAKRIHVFAVGNNILLAKEFEYNMHRIREAISVYDNQGDIFFGASLAEKDDCAIVISYSGDTASLRHVLKLLKFNKVPILAITSIGENPLSKQADCVLRLSTRERLYSKISTFSNDASITYILDVLYSGIFNLNYQKNKKIREQSSRLVEITRSSDSTLLKEKTNEKKESR